ncbi:cytochrome P450 [Umezawaea sp. Da 62-37]|uniref:cytochrome P450 n=1 Tax=Umezawaea sp. Da 62-37 TaxID=3075927 RepID=UPI0028F7142E|nr:cytochrome P450 [Umezawaea sp. Da 62-37]WNV85520.1 cytochrome P450 [Umezawaea sp. Da 62-37]
MTTAQIDLGSTELFAEGDPYEAYRWLRHNAPVYWNPTPDGGFWALSKYEDISEAYLRPELYSSAKGTMLGGSYRSESDSASGQMLIATDPPRHQQLRKQVHNAGFAPAKMDHARAGVRACVNAALDKMIRDGGGDFATDISMALPTGVLAGTMALPPEHAARLQRLTRTMIGFRDLEYQDGLSATETLIRSQLDVFEFFFDLVEQRRERPGDDLVSNLIASEINGEPMSEAEILYNCMNVAVGGNETTAHTASWSVVTFVDHPEQYERLLADPGLLGTAMEEIFRWTATNTYVQRHATRPLVIRGRRIEEGDAITLWNSSANRDEDVFPEADVFDVARTPNKHLTFGVGRHHCIGAVIARLEMEILLGEMVRRQLRFRLAGPVERLHSNFAYGIRHLPVEIVS